MEEGASEVAAEQQTDPASQQAPEAKAQGAEPQVVDTPAAGPQHEPEQELWRGAVETVKGEKKGKPQWQKAFAVIYGAPH